MSELIVQKQLMGHLGFPKELTEMAKHSSQALNRISKAFSGVQEASAHFSERLKLGLAPLSEASGAMQIPKIPDFQGMLTPVFPDLLIRYNQEELEYREQRNALKKRLLSAPPLHLKERNWHRYFPALKPIGLMNEDDFDEYMQPFFGAFLPRVRISFVREYAYDLGISHDDFNNMMVREISARFDRREEYLSFRAEVDAQTIDAQVVCSQPLVITKARKLDQDRHFVREGVKMLKAGEAPNINHAVLVLIDEHGWAEKGLHRNSKGKIIANSFDAARSRLWRKINNALKGNNNIK